MPIKKHKKKSVSAKAKRKRATRKATARKVVGRARKTKRSDVKKALKKTAEAMLEKVGSVTHYFPHVKAAAVKILKGGLRVGQEVYIKGHTTDFKEKVSSMQLNRLSIKEGKKGEEIGLLVKSRVRIGDSVYRI